MLGRIGELDPFSISIPLLQQDWSGAQRALVGRLLQGMRSSGNRAVPAGGDRRRRLADRGHRRSVQNQRASVRRRSPPLCAPRRAGARAGNGKNSARSPRRNLPPVVANLHQVKRVTEEVDSVCPARHHKRSTRTSEHRTRLGAQDRGRALRATSRATARNRTGCRLSLPATNDLSTFSMR